MDKITFILLWLLASLPIVHNVNKRMEQLEDETRYETGFQIFLFIRAQFEVPKFYLITLLNLITPKHK
jgi:NADH:ubiquinone oxidoreductase subunit 3 (subunit A)